MAKDDVTRGGNKFGLDKSEENAVGQSFLAAMDILEVFEPIRKADNQKPESSTKENSAPGETWDDWHPGEIGGQ